MTRARVALLAVALLLPLALLAAAWWGPSLPDWDRYRPQLEEIAGAQLGRAVRLHGRVSVVLLPQPRVEVSGVTIGPLAGPLGGTPGAAAGQEVSVAAAALRLRLGLGPLLTGRLKPREVVLVGAEVRLPWPPAATGPLPSWLTVLDARLEDSRLILGGLRLDGVAGRVTVGDGTEALTAEGSFTWHGMPLRATAVLGRAGPDGAAPLNLSLSAAGAMATAQGVLGPAGFEGRLEMGGPNLATLLPAPQGPFRATGRLVATAELVTADGLALDLGGGPARGAATLRLAPEPRLDLALAASRLDLDAWVAALRRARSAPGALPLGLDLSAETTALAGVPLRRLRGAAFLAGDRLTLSDVSALLPGDAEVDLAGATAGERLELAVHLVAPDGRATLAALGLPLPELGRERLRTAEARFRLALEPGAAQVSELTATLDGARLSGAGVLRGGPRPALGLGITLDRLALDGLLPEAPDWPALAAGLAGLDLNLRLAAEAATWRGLTAERAALDATVEGSRLTVRRLVARVVGLDVTVSGTAALAPTPRLGDLTVEMGGGSGAGLAGLLPARWAGLTAGPFSLRLSGTGPPEALALRAEADAGELRAEAAGTLDLPAGRGAGRLTLRHPGAPRLLAPLLGDADGTWLGEGSFSLIAALGVAPGRIGAESLEVVAGGLRLRGALALALGRARPRLTGRLTAERLPLPAPLPEAAEPLDLSPLGVVDAELALAAAVAEAPGLPPLENLAATLRLEAGALRLEGVRARLGGGALEGELSLDGAARPPRAGLALRLAGATLGGPLLGLPVDLGAGRLDAAAELAGNGHSPAALVATLEGTASLEVSDGVLAGLDLAALSAAAATPGGREAEAAIRRALAGGASAFERLTLSARLVQGRAALTEAVLAGEGGGATAAGTVDLPRGTLDLRFSARPLAEAPEIGLRLTGPATAPRRLPELAPFLRWRAERG